MSPLMFRKHNIGLDVRKLSCGVLQTTNAQTSLRIRSDLEITQLHQTRPSAAVWSNVLIWSGLVIFSVSSRLLMRCFFMFTRISIVDAQLDLGLLSA